MVKVLAFPFFFFSAPLGVGGGEEGWEAQDGLFLINERMNPDSGRGRRMRAGVWNTKASPVPCAAWEFLFLAACLFKEE